MLNMQVSTEVPLADGTGYASGATINILTGSPPANFLDTAYASPRLLAYAVEHNGRSK
jgi:hypothetical protein